MGSRHSPGKPRLLAFMALGAVLAAGPAHADSAADTAAEVRLLKAQVRLLSARLEELERAGHAAARAEPPAAAPATAGVAAGSWAGRMSISGDLRYRHESFDIDGRPDRHRHRVRARTTLQAQVSDDVEVGIGLASGSADPVSTNQTLGDGASSKSVVLDRAYVSWQTPIEGLGVRAGKFSNPLHRAGGNGLVWDGDLRPEGVGVTFRRGGWFANGLGAWLDESAGGADALLLGGQGGLQVAVGEGGTLLAGVGYYNYGAVQGNPPLFDGDARGNRVDAMGNLASGFELLEGMLEYSTQIGELDLSLFADYVNNLDADRFDTAYAVGVDVRHGKWRFGWTWQDVEADAVFGLFTDSDFIGGGTDGRGHILSSRYALGQRTQLGATLFLNERNIDFGNEQDFARLMLDLAFRF